MKKNILFVLLAITVTSFVVISYFAVKNTKSFVEAEMASSTPLVTNPNIKDYTTQTGKIISVENTHPHGESLSTITITSKDFGSSTPITFEKDTLTNILVADLNADGFDEIYFITEAAGSGSYGEITGFASDNDTQLVPIAIGNIKEEDTAVGGPFEGYEGHDTFTIINDVLTREFPVLIEGDASGTPKRMTRKITYTLESESGDYTLVAHGDLKEVAKNDTIKVTSTSTTTPTTVPPTTDLTRTTGWVWQQTIAVDGKKSPAPTGGKFILTFKKDKTMSSATDCNTLSGTYKVSNDMLLFGPLMATLMYCENSHENEYSTKLADVIAYEIKNNELHLTLNKSGGSLVFAPK